MKDISLTVTPVEGRSDVVKACIVYKGNKKEFFVFTISEQDLVRLENEDREKFAKLAN